jgi:hypothetical protein
MDNKQDLPKKEKFSKLLKERFFLRFHMSLILSGTALSGLIVSWALLHLNVKSMLARYPVAVICSYLAFFGFIKLWLIYMSSAGSSGKSSESLVENADIIDIVPDSLPVGDVNVSLPEVAGFEGGGGQFQGAGASGLFDHAGEATDSGGGSIAEAAGDAASGAFDDEGFVLIILGILLAIVFGAALYLLYAAPAILAEAAFDFALASSLVRSARRMDNPDWMGSVFRATAIPFLIVLLVAIAAAGVGIYACPEATKMSEVVRTLMENQ